MEQWHHCQGPNCRQGSRGCQNACSHAQWKLDTFGLGGKGAFVLSASEQACLIELVTTVQGQAHVVDICTATRSQPHEPVVNKDRGINCRAGNASGPTVTHTNSNEWAKWTTLKYSPFGLKPLSSNNGPVLQQPLRALIECLNELDDFRGLGF